MRKRFLMVLTGLAALFGIGWLVLLFLISYEPTPNKGEVEEMVGERDLVEFGEVEGSFLLTPRNYGYYNELNIFIVEQYLDKGREYGGQYVVIGEGADLTGEDEEAISQIKAERALQEDYVGDLQIISKHRMTVYKDDEKIEENWLYKITYLYEGQPYLTFMLPVNEGENRFNFFTEGYEQFLQF